VHSDLALTIADSHLSFFAYPHPDAHRDAYACSLAYSNRAAYSHAATDGDANGDIHANAKLHPYSHADGTGRRRMAAAEMPADPPEFACDTRGSRDCDAESNPATAPHCSIAASG
jgi:hypothetical protein